MKGSVNVITLTILLAVVITIAIAVLIGAIISGVGLIAVFGDVIVSGLIVWLIIKIFKRRKN